MKKSLKQKITGYTMPRYLAEILTRHYSPVFLKMTIVRENQSYMFTYETGEMRRLVYRELTIEDKLTLIQTLIRLNEENEEALISATQYLIEPELIYSIDNSVSPGRVKLLFYPDMKKMSFEYKMALFIDKITMKRNPDEEAVMKQIQTELECRDMNRVIRLIERIKRKNREKTA